MDNRNLPEVRPLTSGEILSTSLRIYRSYFSSLAALVATFVIPVEIVAGIIRAVTTPRGTDAATTTSRAAFFGGIAASLLLGLATQLATAASVKAVADDYLGRAAAWRDSFHFVFSRASSLIVLVLLDFFISVIGLFVFVLPGIYLWVSFLVAVPVLLLEGETGGAALRRSRELVRGRWWPTFGTYFLAALFAGIINIVVSAILLSAFHPATGSGQEAAVDALAGIISAVVTTPFVAGVVALIYLDLRVRKEDFGHGQLAAGLGVEASGTWSAQADPPYPPAP